MAKSKTMERSKASESKAARRLKPSEKLSTAAKLSDFCVELMKAGRKVKLRVLRKKP